MVGWLAWVTLTVPFVFLVLTHRFVSSSPAVLVVQACGLAVVIWARLAFGWRSFHAGSTATAGGLATSGPYRFVRHPIYAGVLVVLCGVLIAHHDVLAVVAAVSIAVALGVRIAAEERSMLRTYPAYVEYARRTKRIIPWVL